MNTDKCPEIVAEPWPGYEFSLTQQQSRLYQEIQDRSHRLPESGVWTHYPRVMLETLHICGLDPNNDDHIPIWYALVGDRWSMFHLSDGDHVRALLKPRSDWKRFIHHFSTREDCTKITGLPKRVRIYRGVQDKNRIDGWSYTTEWKTAVAFASGMGKTYADSPKSDLIPLIAACTVSRNLVLGVCDGRGECEVIVDPRTLRNVEVTELFDFQGEWPGPIVGYKRRPYGRAFFR